MEMTGLDVNNEVIIEVASIITDLKLKPLAQYEAVINQPIEFLNKMDEWNKTHHTQSGLIDKIHLGKPQNQVESELILFVSHHFDLSDSNNKPILAGNSIAQDRGFINYHMKEFSKILHYRMFDVSSWKIIFENVYNKKFYKNKNHRAIDDILESIAEFKYYQSFIGLNNLNN